MQTTAAKQLPPRTITFAPNKMNKSPQPPAPKQPGVFGDFPSFQSNNLASSRKPRGFATELPRSVLLSHSNSVTFEPRQ